MIIADLIMEYLRDNTRYYCDIRPYGNFPNDNDIFVSSSEFSMSEALISIRNIGVLVRGLPLGLYTRWHMVCLSEPDSLDDLVELLDGIMQ